MAWVVDTCVLIDVLEDDPEFGLVSAEALDAHLDEGLHVRVLGRHALPVPLPRSGHRAVPIARP